MVRAVPFNGGAYSIKQSMAEKRFGKKFYRTRFHGAHSHRNIAVGGNENNWDVESGLRQFALKVDSAQPRHMNVKYKAGRALGCLFLQEFPGGRKGLDFQSGNSEKTFGRATNRHIVINYKYYGLRIAHAF